MSVSAEDRYAEPHLQFWGWWCRGIVGAGVREEDLPELSFSAQVGSETDQPAGVFEVIYDENLHRIRTEIRIQTDRRSRSPVRIPFAVGVSVPPDVFAFATPDPAASDESVSMLALQCALFEQFVWRFWETTDLGAADWHASQRGSWLVQVWAVQREGYEPPAFATGQVPVRYAGRSWVLDGSWLVSAD